MTFEADVDRAMHDLLASLDVELPRGMDRAAALVADEAAARHRYQNRTGQLQLRTRAGVTTGTVSSGRIRGQVLGDTRYGAYLEEPQYALAGRFAFLLPAYERRVSGVVGEIDVSMVTAVGRAPGWR